MRLGAAVERREESALGAGSRWPFQPCVDQIELGKTVDESEHVDIEVDRSIASVNPGESSRHPYLEVVSSGWPRRGGPGDPIDTEVWFRREAQVLEPAQVGGPQVDRTCKREGGSNRSRFVSRPRARRSRPERSWRRSTSHGVVPSAQPFSCLHRCRAHPRSICSRRPEWRQNQHSSKTYPTSTLIRGVQLTP